MASASGGSLFGKSSAKTLWIRSKKIFFGNSRVVSETKLGVISKHSNYGDVKYAF